MISVIVPLFNEEGSLKELYRRISNTLKKEKFEIIFVDDGSFDGSGDIIENIVVEDKKVKLITFKKNRGKSAALMAGFRKAEGEILVTLDADLQDRPEEIPRLLDKLNEGHDLVSGWKKERKDPLLFVFFSRLFNYVVGLASNVKLHDINCGLKVYRREIVRNLNLYGDLYRFIPLLEAREGYKVAEITVAHDSRKYGKSKYGLSKFYKGFFDLFTILFLINFKSRPFHFFGGIGLLLFSSGFIICFYLTIIWFMGQSIGRRPLLIFGILLLISGIQLFTSGLLAELIISKKQEDKI